MSSDPPKSAVFIKQFVGCVFDHFVGLTLKALICDSIADSNFLHKSNVFF